MATALLVTAALTALPGWAREPQHAAPKKPVHTQRTATKAPRASSQKRTHAAPAVPVAAAPTVALAAGTDQAETRLIRVYRLTAQGRTGEALAQAQSLARDFPNFQLAQLALGDLLAARTRPLTQFGDVAAPPPEAATALAELRQESRQRVAAEQSEFLAVGSMVVFSIYLRERGSPESKPVGAPHDTTALEG